MRKGGGYNGWVGTGSSSYRQGDKGVPAPGQNDSMREQVKDRTSTCKGGGQGSGEKQEENRLERRGIKVRP